MEGSFWVILTPETSSESWHVQTSVSEHDFQLNVSTRGMDIRHLLSSNGRDPAALQVRAAAAAFVELQRVQWQCVQANC
jgi:hypothetical protein